MSLIFFSPFYLCFILLSPIHLSSNFHPSIILLSLLCLQFNCLPSSGSIVKHYLFATTLPSFPITSIHASPLSTFHSFFFHLQFTIHLSSTLTPSIHPTETIFYISFCRLAFIILPLFWPSTYVSSSILPSTYVSSTLLPSIYVSSTLIFFFSSFFHSSTFLFIFLTLFYLPSSTFYLYLSLVHCPSTDSGKVGGWEDCVLAAIYHSTLLPFYSSFFHSSTFLYSSFFHASNFLFIILPLFYLPFSTFYLYLYPLSFH